MSVAKPDPDPAGRLRPSADRRLALDRLSPMIRAEGLSISFPGSREPLLRDLSFSCAPGERILLLGPSGSGKSTLALCLNGIGPHRLEIAISGTLEVAGMQVAQTDPIELCRHVGIVFQDPETQFCTLTVEDEIAFGLENRGEPPERMRGLVDRTLEEFGLSRYRRQRLDRLSGGMKQRLALACVLVTEPRLLILDEVTSNLDPAGVEDVRRSIADALAKRPGTALIVIEHRIEAFLPLVDRTLVIGRDRTLVWDGDPEELFRNPGTYLDAGVWVPEAAALRADLVRRGFRPPPLHHADDVIRWAAGPGMARRDAVLAATAPGRGSAGRADVAGVPAPGSVSGPAPDAGSSRRFPAAHPAVELSGIVFRYPGADGSLLDGLDLTVPRGGILALVGPNGAGKTTIAKIMTGLLRPGRGSVSVEGRPIAGLRPAEIAGSIGLVFQNPEHQFVADTVFDEAAFALRRRNLPEDEVASRAGALLERLRLGQRRSANPFTLSQGEKRRLSVAGMLAGEAGILVLDEPTFGQDPLTMSRIADDLGSLAERGMTLILITHDMALVWRLADRVAVVESGRVRAYGPTREILAPEKAGRFFWLRLPLVAEVNRRVAGEEA